MEATSKHPSGLKLETPATYRIRVQGSLNTDWSDYVCDMTIAQVTTADNLTVTTLTGRLVDQAALSGVLKTLYDLQCPLLSVENLDEKQSQVQIVTP